MKIKIELNIEFNTVPNTTPPFNDAFRDKLSGNILEVLIEADEMLRLAPSGLDTIKNIELKIENDSFIWNDDIGYYNPFIKRSMM